MSNFIPIFKELFLYPHFMTKTLFYQVLRLSNIAVYIIVVITRTHASVYDVFKSWLNFIILKNRKKWFYSIKVKTIGYILIVFYEIKFT